MSQATGIKKLPVAQYELIFGIDFLSQVRKKKEDLRKLQILNTVLYCCPSGTALQQNDRAIIFVVIHNGNLCVPLCHAQIRMSHLLLEGEQIPAILEPEGSEAVSDLVGGELRARSFTVSTEVSA